MHLNRNKNNGMVDHLDHIVSWPLLEFVLDRSSFVWIQLEQFKRPGNVPSWRSWRSSLLWSKRRLTSFLLFQAAKRKQPSSHTSSLFNTTSCKMLNSGIRHLLTSLIMTWRTFQIHALHIIFSSFLSLPRSKHCWVFNSPAFPIISNDAWPSAEQQWTMHAMQLLKITLPSSTGIFSSICVSKALKLIITLHSLFSRSGAPVHPPYWKQSCRDHKVLFTSH